MSLQAKENLIHDIEEGVGEYLTVRQTRQVKATVKDALGRYEVEEIESGTVSTDLLTVFLDAKRIEGKSEKTLNRYAYILEKMIFGIGKPIEKITTSDIRQWFSAEKSRGLSDRSLDGNRNVCSSFFGWLFREQLIQQNPINNFTAIKFRKEIRKPFTAAEIERLKRACDSMRDLAVIHFLRSTGCRIGEVERLNIDDIDLERRTGEVIGKGDKPRKIFFDDVTAECLRDYLSERKDSSPALFAGRGSERLQQQAFRKMLNGIGRKAKVENVHPHRFRRTLATHLAEVGMPVQEIACILGHENINTTMTYIKVNEASVENKYRRYM